MSKTKTKRSPFAAALRALAPVLALSLCVGLGASYIQGPDSGRAQGKKPKTVLAQHMKKVGGAQRALRKILKGLAEEKSAERFDEAMQIVLGAQASVLAAKNEAPAQAANAPEDKRRGFVADYKRGMKGFLGAWIDLEIALYERDLAAAEAAFEAIGKTKRPGHSKFKKKRDW